MAFKWLCAAVAVALMLAYLVPLMVKMKEMALGAALVIGLVLMLVDLWQSLQSKED
jgi:hypothetical protein